jgi:hypothetical protein
VPIENTAIANRPEPGTTPATAPQSYAAPPNNAAPQNRYAPPMGNAPQLGNAPVNNAGAQGSPVAEAPQYRYPQTNYQGLSAPIADRAPTSGPALSGGAYVPASNSPETTPPAGGYRNEPHGSGLY